MKKITTSDVLSWTIQFLQKCEREITGDELKEQKKYAILIQRPEDKILLSKMLDESCQIRNNKKLAKRIKCLVKRYGMPHFLNSFDTFLLKLFVYIGYLFDFISIPVFKEKLRKDTNKIIIPEERPALTKHLENRRKEGIGQNINLLGEVVLGNTEADNRYHHYLNALKEPDINYISIKISGIYSQLHPLNYEQSKTELCHRLATIYQEAINNPYIDENGNSRPKFVNLDMEEYKDTELTLDVFETVLNQSQFKSFTAGIVIQAYLPDAWDFQTRLLDFAKIRCSEGGAPLKVRLVKGANLQMESIISSLRGWENPVLPTKVEVDANYLQILDRALEPENAKVLRVGVASHNLFTIGYTYLLSQQNEVDEYVTFEMLEGMANHLPRTMKSLGKQVILYTPVVKKDHFLNAVSYLVRRLDENTGKDNFLSYSFNLKVDSEHWNFLQNQFLQAFELKGKMKSGYNRKQDRNKNVIPTQDINTFHNEPDTNFDLKVNRDWIKQIRQKWKKSDKDKPYIINVQIGKSEDISEKKIQYYDKCSENEICVCEAYLSNSEQVKKIIEIAEKDESAWRKTSIDKRNKILHQVADNLCAERGSLIGVMSAITGKTFMEGDVEVSEAIDFCRFYPISMKNFSSLKTISCQPKGIILVIPPWNFPLAIPVGGVAAALSGGNTVILKPATVAYPIAVAFAQCFWDAGVPKDALQVVCCNGREPLNHLTAHPSIKHIILTGGTDTAFRLLENNPTCPLSAETGGKNAIILTSSGDRDHAIQNVVTSAFSNAGQKCSACSLLLVEKDIYNDPDFKTKLKDAVTSIQTGSVWEMNNIVGPMITNENDKLLHAINHLEEGEYWLVEPEFVDKKKYILKPCVKWGVKPGSYTFSTELFAPLLAVVCMDNLEQGIEFVNSSEYGLTSGLQSLDENEIESWKEQIEAGNLYINRGITGAIVNRQPFGGMKRSAFGGGIKAGSPNYVACFLSIKEENKIPEEPIVSSPLFLPFSNLLEGKEKTRFEYAVNNYQLNYYDEFSREKDVNNILGESNIFRYRPLKNCIFRIQKNDKLCDILMVLAASRIAKTPITISISVNNPLCESLKKACEISGKETFIIQEEETFLDEMNQYERVRCCNADLSDNFYRRAAVLGKYIATSGPLVEGRIELLHYLKEQSISHEYHRYGSFAEKDIMK